MLLYTFTATSVVVNCDLNVIFIDLVFEVTARVFIYKVVKHSLVVLLRLLSSHLFVLRYVEFIF